MVKAVVHPGVEAKYIEDFGTLGPLGELAHCGTPELRPVRSPWLAQFDVQWCPQLQGKGVLGTFARPEESKLCVAIQL